jgi:hypothetical protein
MGTPGSASDPSKITATIGCFGPLEGGNMRYGYSVAQFANGNVFASGYVASPVVEASEAKLYSPSQNGFVNAPIIITFDAFGTATYGWWELTLDRATLVVSIQYNDAEVAGGKLNWTTNPAECVKNAF